MASWLHGTLDFFQQYGMIGLFVLSFVEASFFPLPPYLLSIPMTLARPKLGLLYAGVGIAGSVLGGLLGYTIGLRLGRPVLARFLKQKALAAWEARFARFGGWTIAVGGLTPIPYKFFTITAGAFRIPPATFVAASIIARSIRFVTEALLLMFYGRSIIGFLERSMSPFSLVVLVALLFAAWFLWHTGLFKKFAPIADAAWRRLLAWLEPVRLFTARIGRFGWYLITGASLCFFGLVIFAKLADDVFEKELAGFDRAVGGWLVSLRADWLTAIMRWLTDLGGTVLLTSLAVLAVAFLYFWRKRRQDAVILALCMVVALGLSQGLKLSFHRPRPALPWLVTAVGYSFPSGHALLSMSFYGFSAYLALRRSPWTWRRLPAAVILSALPVLVGISRVYLGVHYPTDVLGGWLAALAWLGGCIAAREYWLHKQTIPRQK